MDPEPDEPAPAVIRRIQWFSFAGYVVFAVWALFARGLRDFIGLTCCAAVTMISFLWLREISEIFLQPVPQFKARRLLWRTLARFALLGVALTVTIFVARFDALSVLLGFSIVVVGIMGEAVYALYRSLR